MSHTSWPTPHASWPTRRPAPLLDDRHTEEPRPITADRVRACDDESPGTSAAADMFIKGIEDAVRQRREGRVVALVELGRVLFAERVLHLHRVLNAADRIEPTGALVIDIAMLRLRRSLCRQLAGVIDASPSQRPIYEARAAALTERIAVLEGDRERDQRASRGVLAGGDVKRGRVPLVRRPRVASRRISSAEPAPTLEPLETTERPSAPSDGPKARTADPRAADPASEMARAAFARIDRLMSIQPAVRGDGLGR